MWGNIIVIYLVISTTLFIPFLRYFNSNVRDNLFERILILLIFVICFPQILIVYCVRQYYDSDNDKVYKSLDDFPIEEIERYLRKEKLKNLNKK